MRLILFLPLVLVGCAHAPPVHGDDYLYGHDDRPYTAIPGYLQASAKPEPPVTVCDQCPQLPPCENL